MSMPRVSALQQLLSKAVLPVARIGADPTDSDAVRLQKATQVFTAIFGSIPAQMGLGLLLASFGEQLPGWTVIGFGALTLLLVILLGYLRHHYPVFKFGWSLIALMAPFVGTFMLGGLMNAGFAQLWG